MKYRLIEQTDSFGEKRYVIEKNASMGPVIVWQYIYSSSNEENARKAWVELKQNKCKVLEEIDLPSEPDEPEQPAASPS
jgi:hypothetical protein